MQRFAAVLLNGCLLLPWLWLLGIHVADLSRILVVLSLIALLALRGRGGPFVPEKQTIGKALGVYVFLFPLVSLLFLASRVKMGSVGLDFTLFVQVIDSIARTGRAYTSLLGTEWQDFLGHHLDLVLWIPAYFMKLGISSLSSALLFHFLALSLTLFILWKFCRKEPLRYLIVGLLALLPVFRHSFLWSIHDDVYALPLMAASWYAWRKGRFGLMALSLVLLCLCKETMGLWVAGFSFSAFLWDKKKTQWIFILLGAAVFSSYVFLQPLLLGKDFDHISKVSSFAQFTSPQTLLEKGSFFLNLVLPFALLIWGLKPRWKDWALILPAIPFLGMILISNFNEMWRPLNYYGVIPSFTLLLFVIDLSQRYPLRLTHARTALILSLAFTSGTLKPARTMMEAMSASSLPIPDLSRFPASSRIAISPAAHMTLLQSGRSPLPTEVYLGRAVSFAAKGMKADGAIFLESERADFPPAVIDEMQSCPEPTGNDRFVMLCRGEFRPKTSDYPPLRTSPNK